MTREARKTESSEGARGARYRLYAAKRSGAAVRSALVVAAALALVAGAGCQAHEKRGRFARPGVPARPEGVRPDLGPAKLDPLGLDPRWEMYLGEPIKGIWLVDDTVYAFTAKRNLYSIGLDDGYVHWVYNVRDELSFPPVAYSYRRDGIQRKDEVFLIAKDVLHCLDKEAGFALWKKPLDFGASSPPSASISHVYVGSWDNRVYAIDKQDRSIGWSYRTGAPVTARADAAERTVEAVYVGSEDGSVYAMNPIREERKWVYRTRGAVVARPVFFRNYVYVGSKDFNLYCLGFDGNLSWRYPTGGPILKDPIAYTRETIYVISGDSTLLAMNLQPDMKKEYVRWKFEGATQVLAKGRRDLYVLGPDGAIAALAEDTGKGRWPAPLRTGADFFGTNPFDPNTLVERDRKLASTLVLGFADGWMIAVREKSEF